MRIRLLKNFLIGVIAVGVISIGARAHDARPIYVEISQQEDLYLARFKVPDSVAGNHLPALVMPDICELADIQQIASRFGSLLRERRYRCSDSLHGYKIGLRFPGFNPSLSTVIRLDLSDGKVLSTILPPGTTEWHVPSEQDATSVAGEYTMLGMKHIWQGIDHLLFVLCLLFIAKTTRRILITVTGFTVAHSLTLVLSTLDLVSLPTPVVESIIALSIIFLALEIFHQNENSWSYRHPVSVATSFGLLHGFGFASVLREIGLPAGELPIALLAFNVGVEIGQVLFIGIILLSVWLFRHSSEETYPWVRPAASYLVGGIASFWFIARMLIFWS